MFFGQKFDRVPYDLRRPAISTFVFLCLAAPEGLRDRRLEDDGQDPDDGSRLYCIETELKHCQQVERPRIIQQITEARGHGDLSENAEYHAAKEAQSHNEGRIAELEDKMARAEVIDVSKLSGDTVKFGATVTLIDEDTDKEQVWQIVRRTGGGRQIRPHLDLLAAGARAARQEEGRERRSRHARRRPAYEVVKVEWR